ncbi:hypothetical protein [Streptacidiphilus sp. P02-A3a]|uniref:hypothetical protein n=1 Tax=Streptacidiphilus sp. P02-A3a TaxID=2704468 RepID=UPI0015FC5952|nr:hypothetical protein [Streptacidiphilus sp. P02-A3a]QMU67791.1 hypothetical protein GXP74_05665 [Streptacidiphilus sp. P02-A3a]
MRYALRRAADALDVTLDGTEGIWGWEGRSLSGPASGGQWLRLLAAPAGRFRGGSWDGSEEAGKAVPDAVPRPRLRTAHEWADADHAYRAELYERIQGTSLSDGPLPPTGLRLPHSWWTSLRTSLAAIAATGTDRVAIRQERLDWAMPEFLGTALDTRVPAWATAHADIQWSNLTGPDLIILDWERWGLAPAGYDEATLYISSLTAPELAARVHQAFEPALTSPAGRFSQLVVASEFLQGMRRGNNLELEGPLRRQLALLLG